MTKDEIIELAKEAGFWSKTYNIMLYPKQVAKLVELILASQAQPTPSQSEIGAFAKAISKQAVEDYKASLVPAAYFLRESYDGTDEYNQTDPTVNKAMPLYELGETK